MSSKQETVVEQQQTSEHQHRVYEVENTRVCQTYKNIQQNQTIEYQKEMYQKYKNASKVHATMYEAIEKYSSIKDESDPDAEFEQIIHCYQTGECIFNKYMDDSKNLKKDIVVKELFTEQEWNNLPEQAQKLYNTTLDQLYPEVDNWEWFPLVGFIHDAGKLLATDMAGDLPQWAVVGDTFPLACKFQEQNNYYEQGYYKENVDWKNEESINNTDEGIYEKNCGFEKVNFTWSHDEYLASVLQNSKQNQIPNAGIYIIRYHSFYPWHSPVKSVRGYQNLASEKDWAYLPLLKAFQKSDLYSKDEDAIPVVTEELAKKYTDLMDKYTPGKYFWA